MTADLPSKYSTYPAEAIEQLNAIRRLIFSVAEEHGLGVVEESIKWGEASYRVVGGSPVRIDWKPKEPGVVNVYFQCQTRLVETFRELYPDEYDYEGKRAIVIPLNTRIAESALAHCIELSLKYHTLKHLPLLGA